MNGAVDPAVAKNVKFFSITSLSLLNTTIIDLCILSFKKEILVEESLLDKDFDMALAQLDIQVAPEGIDKMELAKAIYEDFLEAPSVKRDWKKIIEEDRKENRKVFG